MRILITGASGLVGQGVLEACLQAADVSEVVALLRKPGTRQHPKLKELICPDFAHVSDLGDQLQGFDGCLYCAGAPPIGTSEDDYRQVTLATTLQVAQVLATHNPGLTLVYISGAHADPQSKLMVLKVKGETERALQALPIRTVMLRPGGIQPVGDVHSPHPAMASMYRVVSPLMGLGVKMLPGLMTTTDRVGHAMLAVLRMDDPPAVLENQQINQLGGGDKV